MTTSASIVVPPAAIERTVMNQADPTQEVPQDLELVAEELVVEEVSIDGMCGVY
jgi:mycofactocin precursor